MVAAFLAAPPAATEAQQPGKVYRIGWLIGEGAAQSGSQAFLDRLRDAGLVVGQNVDLDVVRPELGTTAEYADLAARLVARSPSVILAANPNSLEAITKATVSIPIVGVDLESDPVAKGWAVTLARPSRNLSGCFLDIPEMIGKQLEMIQEIRPALTRVAVLGDPRINDRQLRATEAVAVRLGVTLHAFALTEPKAIPELVAEAARQKAGALVALTSPLVSVRMKTLADAAVTRASHCLRLHPWLRRGRRAYRVRPRPSGAVPMRRRPRCEDPEGRSSGRSAHPAAHEVFPRDQRQDRQSPRLTIPPSLLARADQVIE